MGQKKSGKQYLVFCYKIENLCNVFVKKFV